MQIMHQHTTILAAAKDFTLPLGQKGSIQAIEEDKKRASEASLCTMNPVASGDNVALAFSSAHKLKEAPSLVPCCEGKELQINEDLIRTGLSAISVKHDTEIQCLSSASERLQVPCGLIKHRNSFRSLHRPDLKRVPYLRRMTPEELESVFNGYADLPLRGKSNNRDDSSRSLPTPPIEAHNQDDAALLHPIAKSRPGSEDLPEGMRLHGARARLYTSVLAGSKAGDQLDEVANESLPPIHLEEPELEDEVQLREELQVLMPPRNDDATDSCATGLGCLLADSSPSGSS